MPKRIVFAVAFVAGGIVTWLILLALHGFAQAEGAMSAAPVPLSSPSDSAIISVICGYFLVSAFGIAVFKTRPALRLCAALAHALLVIAYIMMFASIKNGDPDGYKWPTEACELAVVMAVYFLPWLIVWGVVLSSKDHGEIPSQDQ